MQSTPSTSYDIAIVGGGVLGTSLAYFHRKQVLVVDLDPQGHVEKSLGAIVSDGLEYTPLSKVLETRRGNLLDAVVKTDLENFHLTPGDKALVQTCEAASIPFIAGMSANAKSTKAEILTAEDIL